MKFVMMMFLRQCCDHGTSINISTPSLPLISFLSSASSHQLPLISFLSSEPSSISIINLASSITSPTS
eukprot:scaffold211_cov83-Skeletonema_dohrnii-CCMP3373.AAC.4